METELYEITQFIAELPPFQNLETASLEEITECIKIRYFRRDQQIRLSKTDEDECKVYIVRKGVMRLLSHSGELLDKLAEGDVCAILCYEQSGADYQLIVDEDTLVYGVACEEIKRILSNNPQAQAYLDQSSTYRLHKAVDTLSQDKSQLLVHHDIASVMHTEVVSCSLDTSIIEAAKTMAASRVSSIVVLDGLKPIGILTDKDITRRCVATNAVTSDVVQTIMTPDPITLSSSDDSLEALMLMTRFHIHHLPVVDDGKLVGMIALSDLIREERTNSVYLSSSIRRSQSVDNLVELSQMLPALQLRLVNMGASAHHVGQAISTVGSSIVRRLIKLAEVQYGKPPVPYLWMSAGSHARREQTSHSDQDNAMIISNNVQESELDWYESVANFVCTGLDECGYILCPGNIMAMNPRWRQTQEAWRGDYMSWVKQPEPEALLYSSIFFDARAIHGETQLLSETREDVLQITRESTLFIAHMTANAVKNRPPLGFFRNFVLIDEGEHHDTLDLKHSGIIPVVDLARIYALAEGVNEINTVERIKKVAGSKLISKSGAADLLDAFEFINDLRIKNQARQLKNGSSANNYMPPSDISRLEQEYLKDAFKVIKLMQDTMQSRLGSGLR